MRLVNELRFQFAQPRSGRALARSALRRRPATGTIEGGPTLEVTGSRASAVSGSRRSRGATAAYQVLDTVSYYAGSHQLKAGFDFSTINNKDESLPLHFGGRYIFAAALPGALLGLPFPVINAIQAVALGLPAAYVQGYGNPGQLVPRTATSRSSRRTTGDWRRTSR